ncbi:MAG: glyoxylase-like metal-dependent hydrolase (beta-lactamase superfamily II), partial [Marinoscillum sp.]
MEIKSFVFNPFYENTYLLWSDTKEAIIVDPGCYERYEIEEIVSFIKDHELKIQAIVNTHCHIDHVLGNAHLKDYFNCPLWIPKGELDVLRSVAVYAPQWGIQKYTEAIPEKLLEETDIITFGGTSLSSILVPGHSPGHLMYLHEPSETLIGGDVLFKGSIGRTDLPGGNHQQLLDNIKNKV